MKTVTFRRAVSVLYTIPVCIATTGILICISLCLLPFDRSGAISAWMFRFWARSILAISRVRVNLHGAGKIEPSRRYICAANHSSLIDIPVLVATLPVNLCFVAKQELFRIPIFGAYLRTMRHIPVSRENSRAAAKSMADAARTIAMGTRSVLLFPEGTRQLEGLGEFKEGAALLAIRAGVPLLPIAIDGTQKIWPARAAIIFPGTAEVRIGDAVETEGLASAARAEVTAKLRGEIEVLLSRS